MNDSMIEVVPLGDWTRIQKLRTSLAGDRAAASSKQHRAASDMQITPDKKVVIGRKPWWASDFVITIAAGLPSAPHRAIVDSGGLQQGEEIRRGASEGA